ncbi:MAG: long-chain fatty acid--CoA ligase [Deltaproteobacteria bacterium]|nr:long-chain fatty acid--CoA ligase [Deltaproteobacteria bacterium]
MAPLQVGFALEPLPDSIPTRLFRQAVRLGDEPAWFEKTDGRWVPAPWTTYGEQVAGLARALITNGVQPGDRVCILGENKPEWVLMDVAAMAAGGVPAGIYATCSAEEVAYILAHAEAPVVLVEDDVQWAKVEERLAELPALRRVVFMRGAKVPSHPLARSWEAFLAEGEATPAAALGARLAGLRPEQPATFIYTSGTTGPPKAVMLSHRNLTFTADIALSMVSLSSGDCVLSYLPLSHIAEQMFSIYAPITAGGPVYFAESRDKLRENLVEVQPTVFFGVPRVWEKFAAGAQARLGEATGLKAKLAAWALGVGQAVVATRNRGAPLSLSLRLQYKLADRLVFSKVKPKVGLGRARVCVSGAAPVSPEVLRFLSGLDIVVHEVYGQSEDCGPTTFNPPGNTRFGTVGPAMPGVEVKLGEDGEVLVRGENVFLGYFKDPEATAAALEGGWLHSGDLGSFDEDGFLRIIGRKKEILITSGGKNITPLNIEASLKDLPLVSQAVLIGDRRNYITALLTLDPEAAARWAAARGQTGPVDLAALAADPAVRAELQQGVDAVNARFARVEHVRRFTVLPRDLEQARDELTPTMKVKRRNVERLWAAEIEAMYAGAEA